MGREYVRQVDARSLPIYPSNFLFAEGFRDAGPWTTSGTGADWAVDIDTTDFIDSFHPQATKSCMRIRTRTTDSAAGDIATATRSFPIGVGKSIEIHVYCSQEAISDVGATFEIRLDIGDGTKHWFPRIRWDVEDDQWEYWNSAGAWVAFTTQPAAMVNDKWFHLHLHFNMSLGEYVALHVGATSIDISGITMQSTAATGSYGDVTLQAETPTGAGGQEGIKFDMVHLVET